MSTILNHVSSQFVGASPSRAWHFAHAQEVPGTSPQIFQKILSHLRQLLGRRARPSCDTCAFVEFFRSNGDGQVPRLQTFCRGPASPHRDRPIPPARRCAHWQRAAHPPHVPRVGDPTLTT